ncbi:MAG: hypothetical protein WD576_03265, partial [Nitriliruptoraceae bacterium]
MTAEPPSRRTPRPQSVDDVVDPGVARGSLAAALRPGRRNWDDIADDHELACPASARPYVLSLIAERSNPLLVVTPRLADADAMADDLAAYLGKDRVAVMPPWETLPYERLSPEPQTVGRRLSILDRLLHGTDGEDRLVVIVAPVRAVLQPMDVRLAERRPLRLGLGPANFDEIAVRLAELGYSRTPQVTTRGEYAVRGGIIDVFPTAGDHPVRFEFFGDDIDSIRLFGIADQRSISAADQIQIDPARELVIDNQLRARARHAIDTLPQFAGDLDRLAEGETFEGVESLALMLAEQPALLVDFLPPTSGVVLVDPVLLEERANKLVAEAQILAETAWGTPGGIAASPAS